jgi:trehalose 6-phosphate phosphatase
LKESRKAVISQKNHHAVIFDLDGVITKTATVHAKAWKEMFDEFLKQQAELYNTPFVPFDEDVDYLTYVDGKPRYEGIRSFLESRGIELPLGSPSDPEDSQTVWGLGNKKNKMFTQVLKDNGVEVYQTTINLIHEIRKLGIKTALISSSKNCRSIIETVGAEDLFDAQIDGIDAEKRNIKGKPAPDVFLKAAEELGVAPDHAVVIEDAISGVQAGRDGGFAEVIGVDRSNQGAALLENGADVVVKDLGEVEVLKNVEKKPHALEHLDEIHEKLKGKELAIFLDYDGTLSPITSHPDLAVLGKEIKQTLEELKKKCTLAIISGRDRPDVQSKIGIEGIFYAGSHGFDIAGPNGQHFEVDEGKKQLPALESAHVELQERITEIEGAWVERKRYSIAVHYRSVSPEQEPEVEKLIDNVVSHYPGKLRKARGKKIFELQPDISWNKGKALFWLLKLFNLDRPDVVPIYLGDDVTDEDAFFAIMDQGLGVAVQDQDAPTNAHYTLRDTDEVREFLSKLL